MDRDERAMRIKADPETFYITDHYLNYPWILVRLSTVRRDDLRELLEDAWRQSAPKGLLSSDSHATAATTRPPRRKRRGGKT
jgi:hypothetical protein